MTTDAFGQRELRPNESEKQSLLAKNGSVP